MKFCPQVKMILKNLEKIINSELSSKVLSSSIKHSELSIEIREDDLVEIVQFLKSNEKCKFRQLWNPTRFWKLLY